MEVRISEATCSKGKPENGTAPNWGTFQIYYSKGLGDTPLVSQIKPVTTDHPPRSGHDGELRLLPVPSATGRRSLGCRVHLHMHASIHPPHVPFDSFCINDGGFEREIPPPPNNGGPSLTQRQQLGDLFPYTRLPY